MEEADTIRGPRFDTMRLDQLQRYRKQLDDEMANLKTNINALSNAHDRFANSLSTIRALNTNESKTAMLPLTTSMFVRGKTEANGRVLVDLGTGFLVQVSNEHGQGILQRKLDYVALNRRAFAEQEQQRRELSQMCMQFIQLRVREQTTNGPATAVQN
jgi:prefoldin alpha subunit